FRGFPVGGQFRSELARVSTLDELRAKLATIADSPARAVAADEARGRQGSSAKVALPEGWLDDPNDPTVPAGAEIENNGG
ncbi:tRNA dihydrouridine synthase DusB, partial [Corynebacterium tuscaniense]